MTHELSKWSNSEHMAKVKRPRSTRDPKGTFGSRMVTPYEKQSCDLHVTDFSEKTNNKGQDE